MHPRNIFKENKPNFEALASEYPDFKRHVKRGESGKPFLNFKDPASLRALSVVLLDKYFGISVDIPLDRLIPTVPLRLNYIHWIEDLVSGVNSGGDGCSGGGTLIDENITGVDVGCGASCVYALLSNTMNKWKLICTEVDEESYRYAQLNVEKNNLQDQIKILHTRKDETFFKKVLAEYNHASKPISFTMCNPPFFSETGDGEETGGNKCKRRPPNSVCTATESERSTVGGEVFFVSKMIHESLQIKNKIRWFTSMLGKKSSLKPLIKLLKESNVPSFTTTEFRQGRTMRWGLAWTFTETKVKLPEKPIKQKKAKPFNLAVTDNFYKQFAIPPVLQQGTSSKHLAAILWQITKVVQMELLELKVELQSPEHVQIMNGDAYEITGKTFQNTWIHQRRKRRRAKQIDGEALTVKDINDGEPGSKRKHSSGEDDLNCCEKRIKSSSADDRNVRDNDELGSSSITHQTVGDDRRIVSSGIINKSVGDSIGIDSSRLKHETYGDKTSIKHETNGSKTLIKHETNGITTDLVKPETCLFSFSCTVCSAKQCHVAGGKTPVISLICVDGDKNIFHQMVLYFKNKLHCIQVNSL